jgi:CubicO group peptidase (beta-lactamase class C family)
MATRQEKASNMNLVIRFSIGFLLACVVLLADGAGPLPRGVPERQGVSSAALLELVEALDQQIEGMHSLMIVRHGQVIAEGWWKPYAPEHKHVLYSLSKSFTSSAVGFAIAEDLITIDDEVVRYFPDHVPADASANLKAMRVRDILTMTTGHQDEPPADPDAVSARSFLAQPVPHLPGTHFKYNTPATFMQSAIIQKVSGQTVLDYLRPRLFEPLGIEAPVWETNFEGISLGGYGLRIRTEDIAKFGLLCLRHGKWDRQQLLPAGWMQQATSKQVSNGSDPGSDWNQGYGFQFWRCRHNAFRADGAFGQYCVMMPDQDAVVAITAGVRDLQAVLNVLWDKFLPACQAKPLPKDRATHQRLMGTLANLELRPAEGTASSGEAGRLLNRRYRFADNDDELESLSLTCATGGPHLGLELCFKNAHLVVPCSHGQWRAGSTRVSNAAGRLRLFSGEPVTGTFGWAADDTLMIKICAYETPFNMTLKLKFEEDAVTLDSHPNVAFRRSSDPQLIGRVE